MQKVNAKHSSENMILSDADKLNYYTCMRVNKTNRRVTIINTKMLNKQRSVKNAIYAEKN